MSRRSGPRRNGRSGRTYGGALGLVIGALGVGVLILFLLRQIRGDARERVERASEAAKSRVEEYAGVSRTETESQEAVERPADQEETHAAEERTEERTRTVREFVHRLEEQPPAGQEEENASEETREELRRVIRESVRRSEGSSRDREEGRSEETAGEEERRTSESGSASGSASEQMTVVGVLAKMGEAFQETGGGQFVLSSEDEGNFDLHGKEDELDDVYQQQTQARVVGRIIDEDSQPRKMEVDEAEPA